MKHPGARGKKPSPNDQHPRWHWSCKPELSKLLIAWVAQSCGAFVAALTPVYRSSWETRSRLGSAPASQGSSTSASPGASGVYSRSPSPAAAAAAAAAAATTSRSPSPVAATSRGRASRLSPSLRSLGAGDELETEVSAAAPRPFRPATPGSSAQDEMEMSDLELPDFDHRAHQRSSATSST